MTQPMNKESKEIDAFVQNEYLVETSFSSNITDYNGGWIDDCINNAYFNLARPTGHLQPHALTLSMYGGKVSKHDLFVLEKRSCWKLKCFVFADNIKMRQWIQNVGPEIVIHEVFL